MSGQSRLNDCGCCANELPEPELYNRPGQERLDYRIATYGSLLQRMLARLEQETLPDGDHAGERPLARLTTRAADDFTISLLDSWAVVGDILTFYQERIANEGFLRTATERRSILALARAIGYELNPGVAASTYLAFEVDASSSTPDEIAIPTGTKVQSLPQRQDELPQTFETTEELMARPAWNAFVPHQTVAQLLGPSTTTVTFSGISTNLRVGDRLLMVGTEKEADHNSDAWDVRRVLTVSADPVNNQTVVSVEAGVGGLFPAAPTVYALRQEASIFGHNAVNWSSLSEEIMTDYLGRPPSSQEKLEWPYFTIFAPGPTLADDLISPIAATGMEGAVIAAAAAAPSGLMAEIGTTAGSHSHFYGRTTDKVDLDNRYRTISPGSWVVFSTAGAMELYHVEAVSETSRAEYLISSKVTRLTLDGPNLATFKNSVRQLTVYAAPDALTLAELPDSAPVAGETIQVDGSLPAPLPDQTLVVSGRLYGSSATAAEAVTVKTTQATGGMHLIALEKGLINSYERSTVRIYGNIATATHGETIVGEILGHGAGAVPNQKFKLAKAPLTYTAADTVTGSESTLSIRVDNVEWNQERSLYGQEATTKAYTVRLDNEANAYVHFGDGKSGARLPTGLENVVATYRSGIGLEGEVAAGTLTLLKTKPYGVKGVVNPAAAEGAEDPEKLADARENAPMTVRTLDRIVSLRDYEDFAVTFAGIGKAQAVRIWDGTRELVHLTVADPTGEAVDADKVDLLISAIEQVRDPLREVIVESFVGLTFSLSATVTYDEAYRWDDVRDALQATISETYSFANRHFGQAVSASELLAIMHSVPGVIAVDLDELYIDNMPTAHTLNAVLGAGIAVYDKHSTAANRADRISPAGILTVNSLGITLKENAV